MLGYGSNVHAYRVFNKTSGWVEIAKDVTFDEFNGSQEQFDPSFVENEESPCNAIKKLAIGEVKPQERKEQEEEDGQVLFLRILRKFWRNGQKFRTFQKSSSRASSRSSTSRCCSSSFSWNQ